MPNLIYYSLLILGLSFPYSNAEPIKGHNVTTAEEREFPFVASIIDKTGYLNAERDHFCTGVLITKNHVLKVAHCFERPFVIKQIEIVLGSADLRNGTRYNASSGINYNQWAISKGIRNQALVNDIAIIKLSEEVDEQVAKPAELSCKKSFTLFSSEKVTAVGWGRTNLKPDRASRYLQKASLTVMTLSQCQNTISQLMNEFIVLANNVFCTKAEPFSLLGDGDSGGSILNEKNKVIGRNMGTSPKYIEVAPLQQNNRINLHANVHFYMPFIQDVLKNY